MSATEYRDEENKAIFCAALQGYLASFAGSQSDPPVEKAVAFAQAVVRAAHGGDTRSIVPDYAGVRDTAKNYDSNMTT